MEQHHRSHHHPAGAGLAAIAITLLSACGGSSSGGGAGPSLDAPDAVLASPQNAAVLLDWSEVNEATGYNLYYSTDPGIDVNNPGTGGSSWDWISDVTPPFSVDQLDNRATYHFVVTATDGSRESGPSDEISATPLPGISGLSMQTATRTINAQTYQHSMHSSGAFCEAGQINAGGGFRITSSNQDAALQIHSSFPTSTGAADNRTYAWNGRAFNNDSAMAGSLTAETQVICIDEPEGFEQLRRVGQVLDTDGNAVFSSECSEGSIALNGGALLQGVNSDDPGIRLAYSQSDSGNDAIWRTTLHNVSDDDHDNIGVLATCALPLRGFSRENAFTTRPENWVPAGSFGEHTARCAPGQTVIHGGLYRLGGADGQATDLVLQQSYADTDDSDRDVWRVRVYNSAAEARPMGAFAVCADSDD